MFSKAFDYIVNNPCLDSPNWVTRVSTGGFNPCESLLDPYVRMLSALPPPLTVPTMSANHPPPPPAVASDSLIEYPCAFPIKVVGMNEAGFVDALTHIACQFDPDFDAACIELRESSGGKYMGATLTVTATCREQLDDLYRALSTHPLARWVL